MKADCEALYSSVAEELLDDKVELKSIESLEKS